MTTKHKILLVIDDTVLLEALGRECGKENYLFFHAKEDVVQTVFDEVPHIIIIDENYHRGEGKNMALRIKEDAVLKYIPILLLGREESRPPKRWSIDLFIRRDQSPDKLVLHVKDALARSHNELDLNPLTHLPGTRSSVSRIEHAISSKKLFAVCCLDLSDLTAFNSAYGVARGDQIIVRLAELSKEALKKEGSSDDFLGHLGGDDLIIVTRSDQAVRLSETIIQNFDAVVGDFYDPHDKKQGYLVQRNKEGNLTHYSIMGVSIAIVHNDHMPLDEMAQISQIAGQLKKYMKGLSGSCYVKYRRAYKHLDEQDGTSVEVRFPSKMKSVHVSTIKTDVQVHELFFKAIITGKKIQTVYQPIVDLRTKVTVGYEALTRGVSDSSFDDATLLFAVARESGHVKELDRLCVEHALKEAQTLPPDKKLFLNLNHETLIDPQLMRELFIEKGVLGFKNLVIEVTEQSLLRSFDTMRDALLELKEQGVSVAIDDVGGGAVSLRDVAILRPEYIKFDRSLIRQIDLNSTKQQIVLSMKLFANGIQAMTTAEGIETQQEYETVLACGVNLGQGYYFAKPGKAFPKLIN